jgi:L-ascorbate metabolism protein UlaG (beta-lactamase superfamily)
MEVSWLGGSCFRLHAGGLQIITDPFDLPPGSPPQSGDVATVSRRVAPQSLALDRVYRVVDGPGEYEIKGVPIAGIATLLKGEAAPDPAGGPADRRNIVYTVVLDGVTVCHLGRLDQLPASGQLQEMGSPDVLLLALGEGAGMAVPQALQLASQLEARLLVPVPAGPAGEAAVERFCRELGADPQNVSPRLSVTASGLPAQTQVLRLAPALPEARGGG